MNSSEASSARGALDDSYHYDLPASLIAQDPPAHRDDARLLLVEKGGQVAGEVRFAELPGQLRAGDLLILNDSKVLPARLCALRQESGGRVELLLVRPVSASSWLALARPVRRLRVTERLAVCDPASEASCGPVLEIVAIGADGFVTVACATAEPGALADRWGQMPLPPYIRRDPSGAAGLERGQRDRRRYQTVYARRVGSVAAPTAGLHFTPAVLHALREIGVQLAWLTLHIGPGTFRPPNKEQIRTERLHPEFFHCPAATEAAWRTARREGRRVIAVGTTSLRVLETIATLGLDAAGPERRTFADDSAAGPVFAGQAKRCDAGWDVRGETRLFIRPPAPVTAVDGLLTNFHLPDSSLLMLVAALAGAATWRRAYEHAVTARFSFYSYGDAMLVLPAFGGSETVHER